MNLATSGKVDFPALWQRVTSGVAHRPWSLHGLDHWRRVERNGRLLATRCGADATVVRLFALFHDAKRENEGHDRGHGGRGAEYARELRRGWLPITDDQFELLHFACVWHTDVDRHEDPTIGACWDADRLDLGRVGVIPSPDYMSTAFGREIAEHGVWAGDCGAWDAVSVGGGDAGVHGGVGVVAKQFLPRCDLGNPALRIPSPFPQATA